MLIATRVLARPTVVGKMLARLLRPPLTGSLERLLPSGVRSLCTGAVAALSLRPRSSREGAAAVERHGADRADMVAAVGSTRVGADSGAAPSDHCAPHVLDRYVLSFVLAAQRGELRPSITRRARTVSTHSKISQCPGQIPAAIKP